MDLFFDFQKNVKKAHSFGSFNIPLFFTASTSEFVYPASLSVETLVFILLGSIVVFNLAFLAWEYYKLQQFRKYISPGNTVKVRLLDNEIYIATVVRRPGRDLVCVKILKDFTEYMVHSNRIYTL